MDDAIENKKNSKGSASKDMLGDVSTFARDLAWGAAALLCVAYIGSTVVSITQLTGREIDDLFPTDLEGFPYNAPQGVMDPPGNSIQDLFDTYGTSDVEELTRATLEFIFPLKRTSFPYRSWFISKEFKSTKGYVIAKWFSMTCAGTFCAWRKVYKILIVVGKWFMSVFHNYADMFLFYGYSYFVIYLIMLPFIPIVGGMLSVLSSIMYNIPGGWTLTFAPLMGIFLAIANLFSGGMLNIYSWFISIIMVYVGYGAGFVNMAWWAAIGVALWLYTVAFLFLSPLLHKGGMQKMFEEFKSHKKSLLFITLLITLRAAFKNLSPALSVGFSIGALVCSYLIYKIPEKEG